MDNVAWFGMLMTFLYVVVVPVFAINAGLAAARAESGGAHGRNERGRNERDARDSAER